MTAVNELLFGTEMSGNEGESVGGDADTDGVTNALDDILSFGDDTEISDVDGGGSADGGSAKTRRFGSGKQWIVISDSDSGSDTSISISQVVSLIHLTKWLT